MDPNLRIPQEAIHVELLWPLVPTGETDGTFDWFTGVMSLNITQETWKRSVNPQTDEDFEALRTYAHELFHFFQFITMGFLYNWAAEMNAIIRPIIVRVKKETDVNEVDFAGIKRLINEGSALLLPEEADSIEKHFMKIDSPGESGLTVRSIFESHAYFAERKMQYKIKDVTEWLPHVYEAPDSIYRVAFDFLTYTAGFGVAYEWFPLIASMSLCSNNCVETFEDLCLALRPDAEDDLKSKRGWTDEAMLKFCMEKLPDFKWIIPTGTEGNFHLMFHPCAGKLREAEKMGLFDRVAFYVNPEKEIERMGESIRIQIPMVFRPEGNNKIPVQMPDFFEKGSLLALLSIAAVGKQLTKAAERKTYAIGSNSINRLSWLMHKQYSVVDFKLAAEDIRACDPARMVRLLQPETKEDLNITQFWGKIFFSLPADIEPDEDKPIELVPGVRELMQAIHQKMPLLPVYFHRPFGHDWLRLLAPDEAIVDNQFNILHPRLATLIIDSYEDLLKCGEKLDLNVWIALQCLFGDVMAIISNAVFPDE